MYLREHQAKDILRSAGLPVPVSTVVYTPEEAAEAAKSLGPCVVKAQVRAGSRGKAGFIASAQTPEETSVAADGMLGKTHQGETVDRLLVEALLEIAQELYLGVVLNTDRAAPLVLLSTKGGIDIEQVAEKHPDDLYQVELDPLASDVSESWSWQRLWEKAGLAPELLAQAAALTVKLIELFYRTEAFTLEINPLVVTKQGGIVAGDCKLIVDDAALFRHPELQSFVEINEKSPEARAQKVGVTYVALEKNGSIGVMAGGAGICMTTMDEVTDAGGTPVSFIDLGGGISEENMAAALEIMLSTPGINGLIINVFGGINNCEIMARGVKRVWLRLRDRVTLVIKMRGHSQEEGWTILQKLGVSVVKHGTTTKAVNLLMEKLRAARR
jgi:succinyl-CoA synthetase beta subunit